MVISKEWKNTIYSNATEELTLTTLHAFHQPRSPFYQIKIKIYRNEPKGWGGTSLFFYQSQSSLGHFKGFIFCSPSLTLTQKLRSLVFFSKFIDFNVLLRFEVFKINTLLSIWQTLLETLLRLISWFCLTNEKEEDKMSNMFFVSVLDMGVKYVKCFKYVEYVKYVKYVNKIYEICKICQTCSLYQ